MSSITSANASFILTIPALYPNGVQLQGFAAEDIFGVDAITPAELYMGADGNLSAGFVFEAIKQAIHIQADSASNKIFESWRALELSNTEKSVCNATISLPSIKKVYTLTTGYLTSFPAMADAKRVLQPRKYEVTWNAISATSTP